MTLIENTDEYKALVGKLKEALDGSSEFFQQHLPPKVVEVVDKDHDTGKCTGGAVVLSDLQREEMARDEIKESDEAWDDLVDEYPEEVSALVGRILKKEC